MTTIRRIAQTWPRKVGPVREIAWRLTKVDRKIAILLSAAHFMLIGTEHHKHTCAECAEICEECARDCERLDGMEECVKACRRCAESCRKMAA
jgi:hypothetical protein